MQLTRYLVTSEPFTDGVDVDSCARRILFATRTGSILIVDEATWQRLARGEFDAIPSDLVQRLAVEEILVEDADELSEILERNEKAAKYDDQLFVVIQPTASCQLGCDYCGQHHSKAHLSKSDQDLLVERVHRKLAAGRHRKLFVAWFGAEPLAGLATMRALSPRLRDIAAEQGSRYGAKLITNGLTLTHAVSTEVVREHGVMQIEITLDGSAEFHDARRYRKSGTGTFSRIFANLVDLARRDDLHAQISIRCNVDRRNVDGVSPLIRQLAEHGLQKRVSFYATPVYAWGNDAHKLALPPECFAEREANWMAEMLLHGFAPALVPRRKPIVCLAVMPDGELVDAYGQVFNCTEVSYVPAYGTPNRYQLGTLQDGVAEDRRHVLGEFNARIARREYDCATCRMLPVCGGACPKKWHEGFAPCPSFKWNIKERLLLEFARTRLHQHAAHPAGTSVS